MPPLNNAPNAKAFGELSKRLRELNKNICCLIEQNQNQLPEYDFEILCSPTDNSVVVVQFDILTGVRTLTTIGGAPYTGPDPVKCDDIELESDPIDYCADGVPYTKWVVKSNGEPTGVVFWTDETNSVVPPPTNPIKGDCQTCTCTGEDFFTTVTTDGTVAIPFDAKTITITPNGTCCSATVTFNGVNYTGTPITIRKGRAYIFNKSCPLINEIIVADLNCPDGIDVYAETETETCN